MNVRLLAVAVAAALLPSCAHPAGRTALTPLTVVRDVVDAPLVTLTNVFEVWADRSDPVPSASAGVGVGRGGISPFLGIGLTFWIAKPLSWIFGGVDYVVGRSLWPNWPNGISPWKEDGDDTWGGLYFPSTRELWTDETLFPGEELGLEEV